MFEDPGTKTKAVQEGSSGEAGAELSSGPFARNSLRPNSSSHQRSQASSCLSNLAGCALGSTVAISVLRIESAIVVRVAAEVIATVPHPLVGAVRANGKWQDCSCVCFVVDAIVKDSLGPGCWTTRMIGPNAGQCGGSVVAAVVESTHVGIRVVGSPGMVGRVATVERHRVTSVNGQRPRRCWAHTCRGSVRRRRRGVLLHC